MDLSIICFMFKFMRLGTISSTFFSRALPIVSEIFNMLLLLFQVLSKPYHIEPKIENSQKLWRSKVFDNCIHWCRLKNWLVVHGALVLYHKLITQNDASCMLSAQCLEKNQFLKVKCISPPVRCPYNLTIIYQIIGCK